jgi:glycosyltransferase involved in cell wall biosynthesis
MKVWILNPYGNLPNENWRPHRSYMSAEAFALKGHNVTYWISNIDHRSKNYRIYNHDNSSINKLITIKIVDSTRYFEHISIKRIKYEVNFIKNFYRTAEKELNKPDLIIIGEPALFVSYHFIKFTKKFNIPFIVDMVDLWPELFKVSLPSLLKPLHSLIFYPFYKKRDWFVKKATAILSVSNAYLDLASKINNSPFKKVIYLGVDLDSFKNINVNNLGFEKNKNEIWLIYAGTLGDNYDTKGLIECAKLMENSIVNYKLFIAGDGNLKQFVTDAITTNKLKNTYYLGRVDPLELVGFYKLCDVALSTYSKESTVSMPVKAFDYLAAGLPMLNSLGMDLGDMIESHKLGINYKAGNVVDLFNKLEHLSRNKDLLNEMKENCLEFSKQFDEKFLYKEYVSFCENVLIEINK